MTEPINQGLLGGKRLSILLRYNLYFMQEFLQARWKIENGTAQAGSQTLVVLLRANSERIKDKLHIPPGGWALPKVCQVVL